MEKTLKWGVPDLISERFWQSAHSWSASASIGESPPDESLPEASVAFATSGTSGEPAWIVHDKRSLLASAASVNRHLRVSGTSCWGLALPHYHVGGLGVCARAYEASCSFSWFAGKWNPVAFRDWLQTDQVTHTSLVPTQVHDLVTAQITAPACLQSIVVGGGRLEVADGQAARDLGWPVLASYGMTETASQIATQGPDEIRSAYSPSPLPVLDLWEVRAGESLEISGPALFQGRMVRHHGPWTFVPRTSPWFSTRDQVELLPNRMLKILGRTDDLVKVLGELVSPTRLESILRERGHVPASLPFAIVALPDARTGHRLVPATDDATRITELDQAIHAYNQTCPGYLRLRQSVVVRALPRGGLGKIRRGKLAEIIISTRDEAP